MSEFHMFIIIFGVFFFIGAYFTVEVKRFLKEKREHQEYLCKEFIRNHMNIDIK